jgi:hypothetical protein
MSCLVLSKTVDNGKKVVLVPMNDALTTSDLADNLHPNDGGYEKMAAAYYQAIQAADADGLISKPGKWQDPPDATSPDRCRSTPSWYRVGFIADGAKVYVNSSANNQNARRH